MQVSITMVHPSCTPQWCSLSDSAKPGPSWVGVWQGKGTPLVGGAEQQDGGTWQGPPLAVERGVWETLGWWSARLTETSTWRNNRTRFPWYLHTEQLVFPLSLHTELLFPVVLCFPPRLSSELKSIIFSLDYCDLLC